MCTCCLCVCERKRREKGKEERNRGRRACGGCCMLIVLHQVLWWIRYPAPVGAQFIWLCLAALLFSRKRDDAISGRGETVSVGKRFSDEDERGVVASPVTNAYNLKSCYPCGVSYMWQTCKILRNIKMRFVISLIWHIISFLNRLRFSKSISDTYNWFSKSFGTLLFGATFERKCNLQRWKYQTQPSTRKFNLNKNCV